MIIGITGTHGTGKTTYLYKLAQDYKIRYPHTEVKVISEGARECPLKILGAGHETVNIETQMWLFGRQLKEELGRDKSAITITDRTIFDVIAYTMIVDKDLAEEMYGIGMRMGYDKIYFLRPTGKAAIDGTRGLDEGLRKKVDENLGKILNSQDLNIREVKIHHMGSRG